MNEQKLEGFYGETFLVAAEIFYPMACSLTAGLLNHTAVCSASWAASPTTPHRSCPGMQ